MIFCNIIFREYSQNNLQKFDESLLKHAFESIENLSRVSSIQYDSDINGMGERVESKYLFSLKDITKKINHEGKCVSIAEMNYVLDQIQRELKEVDLEKNAFYTFTLTSKDFYPHDFSLQSIFPVHRIVLGNIFNESFFNPVLSVRSEKDSNALQEFLKAQKSIQNFLYNMATIFEHDQEFFSVYFDDYYGDFARVIELKIPYEGIRRIVASVNYVDGAVQSVLTFQLAFPPLIFPHRQHKNENDSPFFIRNRYTTWNGYCAKEEDICLSTCLSIECFDMDPHEVLSSLDRLQKLIGKEIEFGDLSNNTFVKHRYYEKNFLKFPDTFPENLLKLNEQKYFPLVYAVEAIVSRGGSSYDYFFRKPYACFEAFLKLVSERYENDLEHEPNKKLTRTVRALELMLVKFDHILNIPEPIAFFTKCYEQLSEFESSSELIKTGFMRIRKVIVTPSRVLLCNPDIVPGNRCLRKYGDDNMIRVIFRDENLSKLYGVQKILIVKTVENFLKVPQWIGMRQFSYFCSSNSLLKDHGCYFVAGTQEDAKEFRIQCGNFKVESIPKMISQLGQCLTQSHKSSFELNSNDYCEVPDNVGGLDANGNPFIFSDGVGSMPREVAKQIALDLGHPDYLPSCVEFRFRGYKGILSIDSSFDKTRTALLQNQRNDNNNTDESYHKKIMFRPSQKTFDAPKDNSFEIVKVSMPICVNLNKPLINILDQVSEKQDSVIHTKVKNRITSLLDRDILGIISTLIDPKSACLALKEFLKLIPYQLFDNFNITEEPFFRSLLFSSARIRLNRLIEKINIRIPSTHGRMMIGVFDESGILEPGQVFIRYTTDANLKFPSESSDKTTLVGSVMITKNSSIVPGDVRMFEAVDIELLHELIDVVVFSGKGDRPNSNEMSGANLDGDQFKVIWDPEFILHHNEKSFDYHSPSATEIPESFNDPNSDNTVSDLMIKSFKTFIMEDSIGAISNAHLANSDIYGIFSETCSKIAVKHDKAVNFQETGIIPDGLTRQWSEDGMQPPEKVERYPNFMPKIVASSYKSVRFLGGLHERLFEFKEILKHEKCDSDEIIVDPSFVVSDDQVYYDDALKLYNEYSILIQNLCESYGIQNDGELFSGHFIALKNRLFERDEDKMSFFNTEYIIEEQMANIFEQIRIKFFEKSGELERNTEIDDKNGLGIPRQAFSPICFAPTSELCKKASAFYRVAYERKKYLSFAWSVADILMVNRKSYCSRNHDFQSTFSLEDKLSQIINDSISKFETEFDIFCRNMDEAMHLRVSNDFVSLPSAQICHHNNGLRKLFFFIRKWGAKQRLDEICPKSLDALVILFGSGRFDVTSEPYITIPYYRDDPVDDLENKNGGLGRIFLNFIQGLLTQKFISSDVFSLLPFSKRVLPKHQCLMLHHKAIETVYPIAFNRIFHTLPGVKKSEKDFGDKIVEAEMFVIEMPLESENYEELLKKLGEKCGCKYVTFKIKSEPRIGKKTFRVALQAVGTFWATWKFREILLPPPNMNEPNFEQRNALLGDEAYKRLQFFISEENSIDDIYPF